MNIGTKIIGIRKERKMTQEDFALIARKGNKGITIKIDENKKIIISLYPDDIEIDEKGNLVDKPQKLTNEQKDHLKELLTERKEEVLPIISRALELWQSISKS